MAILTRFMQGQKAPAQSDAITDAANWQRSTSLFRPASIEYDLVAQLTYMSALATANVGRESLFQKTAEMRGISLRSTASFSMMDASVSN